MKVRLLALLLVGPVLIAAAAGGDGKEKKRDGTWVAVAMEQDGVKLPAGMVKKLAIKLVVTGDKYKVIFGGKVGEQGTSKDDWTKKPATIDVNPTEGPNQGKTILAIVAIEGDSMKVCYDVEGKERPKSFTTKEGSGHLLINYEREKK
jgi:uncharacterized protein (TIGR03067 family)